MPPRAMAIMSVALSHSKDLKCKEDPANLEVKDGGGQERTGDAKKGLQKSSF